MKSQITEQGFEIIPDVIPKDRILVLLEAFEEATQSEFGKSQNGQAYAARNVLHTSDTIRQLAFSDEMLGLAKQILGENALPVKAILFDKTPEANWKVTWHQDKTIAVQERKEVEGFGPWSMKAGVPHVQPTVEVLEYILTLRLHLDDCDKTNGALRVIPGSHQHGKLSHEAMQELIASKEIISCPVPAGGVLMMRPLLLHSSSPATAPHHRRVIHVEYAAMELPSGLEWDA